MMEFFTNEGVIVLQKVFIYKIDISFDANILPHNFSVSSNYSWNMNGPINDYFGFITAQDKY